MSAHMTGRFGTAQQTSWDWRAAVNFICGGAGSSLLAIAAVNGSGMPHSLAMLAGLALIGIGLVSVWAEIGRPWRAVNVTFHPQTSWMTREAFVAGLIALLVTGAIFTASTALLWAAGLAGLLFLYCQARIFKAARGIPAWREPSLLPLVVGTGLAEGAALAIVLDIAAGAASTGVLLVLLIVLVVLRAAAWWRYRSRMNGSSNLPNRTRETLASIHSVMLVAGTLLPLVAAGTAWAIPAWQTPAVVVAALLAIAAGWQFKFAVVTKAAQVQGYALGATLRRGHPLAETRR